MKKLTPNELVLTRLFKVKGKIACWNDTIKDIKAYCSQFGFTFDEVENKKKSAKERLKTISNIKPTQLLELNSRYSILLENLIKQKIHEYENNKFEFLVITNADIKKAINLTSPINKIQSLSLWIRLKMQEKNFKHVIYKKKRTYLYQNRKQS